MRALFLQNEKEFVMADLPSQPEDGKVYIKVKSMGICGSDLSVYKGTLPIGTLPRVLGHEIAGEVVSIPMNNKGLKVGDRVAVEPYQYCGSCYPCSLGRTNCCENMKVIGVHQNGGFMEYINHDLHLVHKAPEDMTWEEIAMVEPLTISMNGVERIQVKDGEYVVITGAGAIGMLAALYVVSLGAIPIVIDPVLKRLELAKTLGIQHSFDPRNEDVLKAISSITKGRMADVAIEASGSPIAVRNTIDYVSYMGRIVFVGYPSAEVALPTHTITRKEIVVTGARNCVNIFPKAIDLIHRRVIDAKPIISKIVEFEELPGYFRALTENPEDYLKIIALIK